VSRGSSHRCGRRSPSLHAGRGRRTRS
jgi:hypothetical protein